MNSIVRQKNILENTEKHIRKTFDGEGSGHDWWHIYRVKQAALKLGQREGGDLFVIEMAALLHDLDDWKLGGDENASRAKKWLSEQEVDTEYKSRILEVISQVSYKGAGVETPADSIEARIVQDADRLDAIGAIGIARTFAYGGNKNRLMFDPAIKPEMHQDFETYQKTTGPTINHFYEKLLLLKDRMNTASARKMAQERHQFMEEFLQRFFLEWEGEI